MDFSKLTTADKVIAGGGIGLFIAQFLPWFSFGPFDASGWDVGFLWSTLPMLLGFIMIAHVALVAFSPDTNLPDLPVTWGQIHLGAGALAALLVVLKLLIGEEVGGIGFSESLDRSIGLFLAAIAAIALAVGGFLKFQEEKAGGGAGGPAAPGGAPPQPF